MQPAERTKSVYFLRHAEGVGHPVVAAVFDSPSLLLPGEHNLKIPGALAIHDAPLTTNGEAQCRHVRESSALKSAFAATSRRPQLIVTSPLLRTLQTTELALGEFARGYNIPVALLPLLQEVSASPCDTGRPPSELETHFRAGAGLFDFSTLPGDWANKTGIFAPSRVRERAERFRRWVWERPEDRIMVVGHGGIFKAILGSEAGPGSFFQNAELRSLTLSSDGRFRLAASPEERITRFFQTGASAVEHNGEPLQGKPPPKESAESAATESSDKAVALALHKRFRQEENRQRTQKRQKGSILSYFAVGETPGRP